MLSVGTDAGKQTDLLTNFFSALNQSPYAYCVVGDVSELPCLPENDVDLVVRTRDLHSVRRYIVGWMRELGGVLVQCLQHELNAFYHVFWFSEQGGERSRYVKIDVCSDYRREGRLILAADWLLEDRLLACGSAAFPIFYVPAPSRQFAYYLAKRVHKRSAGERVLQNLNSLWEDDPDGCHKALAMFWSEKVADELAQSIRTHNPRLFNEVSEPARSELLAKLPPLSVFDRIYEWRRRLLRVWAPTGLVLCILGPDGAGKTTLIDRLTERMKPVARNVITYHLYPPIKRQARSSAEVVVDPHAKPLRGVLASTLKLLYMGSLYNFGWWRSVWWPRRRSSVILFDRYFYDVMADPLRYRNGAPNWLVGLVAKCIPAPDLTFVLDAPPKIVRARKVEVSYAESLRQRQAYIELGQRMNAFLVDASYQPSQIADFVEKCAMGLLAARSKRYFAQSISVGVDEAGVGRRTAGDKSPSAR